MMRGLAEEASLCEAVEFDDYPIDLPRGAFSSLCPALSDLEDCVCDCLIVVTFDYIVACCFDTVCDQPIDLLRVEGKIWWGWAVGVAVKKFGEHHIVGVEYEVGCVSFAGIGALLPQTAGCKIARIGGDVSVFRAENLEWHHHFSSYMGIAIPSKLFRDI
jgi:hypothetical protein